MNDPISGVYALHLGDGRYRYIGQSGDIHRRLQGHRGGTYPSPVTLWVREHPEEIQVTVLVEMPGSTREERVAKERALILELSSAGHDLLNLRDNGAARLGFKGPERFVFAENAEVANRIQEIFRRP